MSCEVGVQTRTALGVYGLYEPMCHKHTPCLRIPAVCPQPQLRLSRLRLQRAGASEPIPPAGGRRGLTQRQAVEGLDSTPVTAQQQIQGVQGSLGTGRRLQPRGKSVRLGRVGW